MGFECRTAFSGMGCRVRIRVPSDTEQPRLRVDPNNPTKLHFLCLESLG